jgi:hypothetical protein
MEKNKKPKNCSLVLASCDEGLQLNEGIRLGFVGAGLGVDNFKEILEALKKCLGDDLSIASSQDDDFHIKRVPNVKKQQIFIKEKFDFFAKKNGLTYVGHLDFKEPQVLKNGIKGHMVRPVGIHVAQNICFTLGGGEQVYNLANFVFSSEWVSLVDYELASKVMKEQIEFVKKLAFGKLNFAFQEEGSLDDELIQKNKEIMEKIISEIE